MKPKPYVRRIDLIESNFLILLAINFLEISYPSSCTGIPTKEWVFKCANSYYSNCQSINNNFPYSRKDTYPTSTIFLQYQNNRDLQPLKTISLNPLLSNRDGGDVFLTYNKT